MKYRSKMIVTLSMLWIGAMGLASTPDWIRAARDFVSRSTGHKGSVADSSGVAAGAFGQEESGRGRMGGTRVG
ncbi:MAG: hypothetical protein HY323_08085 [Betaproteobacteria bacterium]|nr:hypothetical protein [Betaproteobacteria bacterium]